MENPESCAERPHEPPSASDGQHGEQACVRPSRSNLAAKSAPRAGLADEPELCRRDARQRRREHESAWRGLIAQARPGAVDFLQLAESRPLKTFNRAFCPDLFRGRAELPVELLPREAQRSLDGECPVREPEVQVEPEGDRLRLLRMCRSIGTGCAMISLKNCSPSWIVLSHNTGASGCFASHQNSVRSRGLSDRRACAVLSVARSTLGYQSRLAVRDAPALAAMRRLAAQYPRYGYRRIRIFLRREGHVMSPDRTHRLWRQAGL